MSAVFRYGWLALKSKQLQQSPSFFRDLTENDSKLEKPRQTEKQINCDVLIMLMVINK